MTAVDQRPAWNLLTGTLTNYVLLVVTIALGIFLMPFTMSRLGQEEYGVWMLAASMTAYFQLLDLGYGSGLIRQITQADARDNVDEVNVVLSTFVVVYSAIAVVTLAATAALTLIVVPRFPNLSPAQVVTAQYILAILGVRMAIGFPMGVFGAVTSARQRFALTGSIAICVALVQAAITYYVLTAGYGVVTLVASTSALGVASYLAYAAAARHTFPGMRLSPSRFSVQHVRDVTAFSLYLFLISIAYHASTNVDNVIVGAYVGTSAIAVYTVAIRLAEYQRQFCGQFLGLLFPMVVRFHERRDAEALRATLLDGTRIALGLVTVITLGLMVFGRDLIALWMGTGFEGTVVPMYILALAGIAMVAQSPTGTILLGTGRHRLVAWASVSEIAGNIALSIALVGPLGLTGVAIGTAVPFALINLLVLMPIACRAVGVPLGTFVREAGVPSIVALIPAAVVSMILRWVTGTASLPALAIQATIVGLVYVLAFWLMGLTSRDRARYTTSIRQLSQGVLATPRVATP